MILVFGLGRSGIATSRLLAKQGHSFEVYDDKPDPAQVSEVTALGGKFTATPLESSAHLCIAAPGVPLTHPGLQALTDKGVEIIGEVEWVYRTVKTPLIGITGTAGKGSVTRWLCDVLVSAGKDAVAGGNIDPALAEVALDHEVLVAELSSFQLERCPTLKPRIAVVLNLGQDHIDRHGSLEHYHEAKRAIIQNQDATDTFIYNADDPKLKDWAKTSSAKCLGFSLEQEADAYLKGDCLMLGTEALLQVSSLQVAGKHQFANALAVALAARVSGLESAEIRLGLTAFQGLEGRYALAGTRGHIRFIEDSIATRTLAVKAALEATEPPIVWIAGGEDKGADFGAISELIRERVSLFVGMGKSGQSFAQKVAHLTQTSVCLEPQGSLALGSAVKTAVSHLEQNHQARGTVLFAPLAASFDQFKDYKDRAKQFRQVVKEWEK
ncbi:MAG: UDP-N-acetylmuramoyl-L-alanine--D-glutamate ligase [Trueperaceae bacterium]|nr:UDP-N-acetylmuramoyl-L-alanine--D-glutamate ligase [Trueperaceae bacterium]